MRRVGSESVQTKSPPEADTGGAFGEDLCKRPAPRGLRAPWATELDDTPDALGVWAWLLQRMFAVDVMACQKCEERIALKLKKIANTRSMFRAKLGRLALLAITIKWASPEPKVPPTQLRNIHFNVSQRESPLISFMPEIDNGRKRRGGKKIDSAVSAHLDNDHIRFVKKGSRMKRSIGTAMMFAVLFVLGCDRKDDDTGPAAGAASSQENSVEQALGAANEESGGRIFDASLTEKACELLSPEGVGQAFGIPAAELEPMSVMGCTYRWKSKAAAEAMQLDARFSTIQVHKDVEAAKRWFANATKGLSQEETREAMDAIAGEAKKREEIDTEAKEKAVDQVGDALVDFAGAEGFQFESVAGVGDEARLDLSDGGLWIRTGNLTFVISGYYGPPAPKPDMKNVELKDMAKAALAVEREWVKETMTKRKDDAIKLASVILKALP